MQSGDSNFLASTIASQVIEAGCITATDGINGTRFGGERVRGFIDQRFGAVMDRSASTLSQGTRSNLGNGQQRVRGFCVKDLYVGTDRAQSAVGVAVDPATKGVSLVASNATRLDHWTKPNALDKLNRVVMPAAAPLNSVAAGIEEGDTDVVKRLTKVAAQQVDDAVETGELIAQGAAEQVNEQVKKAVATHKKSVKTAKAATKTATKRVSKTVADTATDTSNAARRVARKAEEVAEAACGG
jgi:hypothetical protein